MLSHWRMKYILNPSHSNIRGATLSDTFPSNCLTLSDTPCPADDADSAPASGVMGYFTAAYDAFACLTLSDVV